MPILKIRRGGAIDEIRMAGTKMTIGRDPDCDVVIDTDEASRIHCHIERMGGEYHVMDLNSRNGIRVNGFSTKDEVLAPGDVISIGNIHMTFMAHEDDGKEEEAVLNASTAILEHVSGKPPTSKAYLILTKEDKPDIHVIENERTIIGRSKKSDIQINETCVSAYHAEIIRKENDFKIRDLASTNGTFVNRKRVTEESLTGDDFVQFGKIETRFSLEADSF